MADKKQKSDDNSIIDFIITEVMVNGVFRFFGWVFAGIAGLFTGD